MSHPRQREIRPRITILTSTPSLTCLPGMQRCMEFWQSVFWFSTCVGCAALASACAAISTLACWSCRSCNSDNLSLGEAVRGGVLFGVGLALVVLLLKTIIESFLRDAVWTLCTTICLCCFFFGGGMSSGHVDNWTSDD